MQLAVGWTSAQTSFLRPAPSAPPLRLRRHSSAFFTTDHSAAQRGAAQRDAPWGSGSRGWSSGRSGGRPPWGRARGGRCSSGCRLHGVQGRKRKAGLITAPSALRSGCTAGSYCPPAAARSPLPFRLLPTAHTPAPTRPAGQPVADVDGEAARLGVKGGPLLGHRHVVPNVAHVLYLQWVGVRGLGGVASVAPRPGHSLRDHPGAAQRRQQQHHHPPR